MFRDKRLVFLSLLAGLLVLATGCPENGSLDDGDSAPVVFEVEILNTPAVTAQPGGSPPSCATPSAQVQQWDANAVNSPKTAGAITSPFNDIDLRDVTITYTCDAGLVCPPQRVHGLTGTVPADSTVQFKFNPIYLQDVDPSLLGTSVDLNMVFRSQTISGEDIFYTTAAVLSISSCVGAP